MVLELLFEFAFQQSLGVQTFTVPFCIKHSTGYYTGAKSHSSPIYSLVIA